MNAGSNRPPAPSRTLSAAAWSADATCPPSQPGSVSGAAVIAANHALAYPGGGARSPVPCVAVAMVVDNAPTREAYRSSRPVPSAPASARAPDHPMTSSASCSGVSAEANPAAKYGSLHMSCRVRTSSASGLRVSGPRGATGLDLLGQRQPPPQIRQPLLHPPLRALQVPGLPVRRTEPPQGPGVLVADPLQCLADVLHRLHHPAHALDVDLRHAATAPLPQCPGRARSSVDSTSNGSRRCLRSSTS